MRRLAVVTLVSQFMSYEQECSESLFEYMYEGKMQSEQRKAFMEQRKIKTLYNLRWLR